MQVIKCLLQMLILFMRSSRFLLGCRHLLAVTLFRTVHGGLQAAQLVMQGFHGCISTLLSLQSII